jgi:hypothetical protein
MLASEMTYEGREKCEKFRGEECGRPFTRCGQV